MAMAYEINFWYHFSKALAPLEVGYAPAKLCRCRYRGEDFQELGGVLS